MLVGHEVGHALYTPDTEWWKEVQIPQQFVNVVEDARIEKLIKRRYEGLNKTFYNAYHELSDKDFFDIENKDMDEFNLADRVNLYLYSLYQRNPYLIVRDMHCRMSCLVLHIFS